MKIRVGRRLLGLSLMVVLLSGMIYLAAQQLLHAGSIPRNFSSEGEKFPSQLSLFITAGAKASKAEEKLTKEFGQIWMGPQVTAQEREQIVTLSNRMLQRTARNRNYLTHWRTALMHYLRDSVRSDDFALFTQLLSNALERRDLNPTAQLAHIQNTWRFLQEDKLYTLPGVEWHVPRSQATFSFEPQLEYIFHGVELVCVHGSDSIGIASTSAVYDPFTQQWRGQGGKVLWTRYGMPEDQVHAQLRSYTIDLTKSRYAADSVTLVYPHFLSEPILGAFEDRLLANISKGESYFPLFTSYQQNLELRNLTQGVTFRGGCRMVGNNLVGVGTPEQPILFNLEHQNRPFINVRAEYMVFLPNGVETDYAQATIRVEHDSLYHSGLRFEFDSQAKVARFSPSKLLITRAPIYSSYHKLTIFFDEIQWRQGDQKLIFGPKRGSNMANALFLSDNFFNLEEFDAIMGREADHPVLTLNNYVKHIGSNTFTIDQYTRYLGRSTVEVQHLLMDMAVQGFVLYDQTRQRITLQPRLFNQVKARYAEIDYDAIRFASSVGKDQANAVLDLGSADLDIFSVREVNVSDSQRVMINPANGFLKVKKNRNMEFSGGINVGLFRFEGEGLAFNYENYTIDLQNIRKAKFDVLSQARNLQGERIRLSVLSELEKLSGFVHIDKPDNKSGMKKYPEYPKFESTSRSRVYYDSAYEGIYDRERFYFELEPFTLENLNGFEPADIAFKGTLQSADIFGPFEETLVVRSNLSLGFRHKTAPAGVAVYQGKGVFHNIIDLSSKGLRGQGAIEYITSRTESEQFNFFPDSTLASSTSFQIAERATPITYPQVLGGTHPIRWLPYDNVFHAMQGQKPFSMYHTQSTLMGDLTLRPLGLLGSGQMNILSKANALSQKFEYEFDKWHSKDLSIAILNPNSLDSAFVASTVHGLFDYTKREGRFWNPTTYVRGDINMIQYQTVAERIGWPVDKDQLIFTTAPKPAFEERPLPLLDPPALDRDTIPAGSVFLSIHPVEEQLYFTSRYATLHLLHSRLDADSVPYVLVADAIAIPSQGQLSIERNARMLPLKQAQLIANSQQRYHRVYDADLNITMRSRYVGKGYIDYVDELDSIHPIRLDTIYITPIAEGKRTRAHGYIPSHKPLELSPHFSYEGQVTVDAHEPHYLYAGGARPKYDCPLMAPERLAFTGRLNPDSLFIPIEPNQQDLNGMHLISGTVVSYDSTHLYPSFASKRFSFMDASLSRPEGYMTYDKRNGRFIMADAPLLQGKDTIMQRIELDPMECRLFNLGRITMPIRLGRVGINTTGQVIHELKDTLAHHTLFLDLNFPFSQEALAYLANDLASRQDLLPINQVQDIFLQALQARIPRDKYERARSQAELFGELKDPVTDLASTISLTDLRLRWDQESKSFCYAGRIPIAFMGGSYVGRRVNGFIELKRRIDTDNLTLYLEPSPGVFYLFFYDAKSLFTSSSSQEYIKLVNKLPKRKRKLKAQGNQPAYYYGVGTNNHVDRARSRYQQLLAMQKKQ